LLWYITLKFTHVFQSTEYNLLWLMETRVSILALSINCTAYAEPSYKVFCELEVMWKEVYGVKVHLMQYTSNPTSCLEDLGKIMKAE